MNQLSSPKILFYPHIPYRAQFYLRYAWPASRLKYHGWDVRLVDPRFASEWDEYQMAEDFEWADIVVLFTAKSIVGPRLLSMCLEKQKKLVMDTDDNTFKVDESNVSYEWSGTRDVPGLWTSGIQYRRDKVIERHEYMRKTMLLCDAVTVTQQQLAKEMEPYIGRGEIYVLPNSLDLTFYKPWPRIHKGLRIGWQGGASHWKDMKIIEKPLEELAKKHDFTMVFFGQIWDDQKKLFPNAEFHPWVDQDTFHVKLGELNLDIGLCPIEDTDFNRGKSNLKMLEYGAFNVPSVCSRIPSGPYNPPDGVDFEDRILVNNTFESWYDAIESLVKDKEKRKFIGDNARKTVEEVYNIDVTWKYWAECYGEVHERVVEKPL